ncbi:NADH-quinone oxidoreductase subunit N [Verrucomicrobia bacterium LW23]|nr:NADH-quinone oxidoreductase subunit N [Verrucomicrobia bacterium LW23]
MPYLAPEIILTALAIVLLLLEAYGAISARSVGIWSLVGIAVAIVVTLFTEVGAEPMYFWTDPNAAEGTAGKGLYMWDATARFYKLFFLGTTGLVIWMSMESAAQPVGPKTQPIRAEFYILPLFVAAGMCLLASAADFMVLFVSLELVTITFYILVAYQRESATALEAGVKYLILGGLATAFLVMGIAYVAGFAGTTSFAGIIAKYNTPDHLPVAVALGLLMILVGFGFKIASVPFHLWAPDVYQGAPTPITAFLSVGSKAAGFIVLVRVLNEAFGPTAYATWGPALTAIAGCSLVLGNFAAMHQRNIKRMLAYSGVGHSGFILMAVLSGGVPDGPGIAQAGMTAVAVYLATYFLASLTAFLVITIVSPTPEEESIRSYNGLWQRSPLLAAALAASLISLAGIPPFAGFVGKLGAFVVALQFHHYGLFFIAAISAVAGLYYYLGVVKAMFWSEPLEVTPIQVSVPTQVLLTILIFLLIATGLCMEVFAWLVR